jgi:hypothetical protein
MKNYKGERNGVEFCRGIEWVLFLGVPIKWRHLKYSETGDNKGIPQNDQWNHSQWAVGFPRVTRIPHHTYSNGVIWLDTSEEPRKVPHRSLSKGFSQSLNKEPFCFHRTFFKSFRRFQIHSVHNGERAS